MFQVHKKNDHQNRLFFDAGTEQVRGFVLKVMNFALKMMEFALKTDGFCTSNDGMFCKICADAWFVDHRHPGQH